MKINSCWTHRDTWERGGPWQQDHSSAHYTAKWRGKDGGQREACQRGEGAPQRWWSGSGRGGKLRDCITTVGKNNRGWNKKERQRDTKNIGSIRSPSLELTPPIPITAPSPHTRDCEDEPCEPCPQPLTQSPASLANLCPSFLRIQQTSCITVTRPHPLICTAIRRAETPHGADAARPAKNPRSPLGSRRSRVVGACATARVRRFGARSRL